MYEGASGVALRCIRGWRGRGRGRGRSWGRTFRVGACQQAIIADVTEEDLAPAVAVRRGDLAFVDRASQLARLGERHADVFDDLT